MKLGMVIAAFALVLIVATPVLVTGQKVPATGPTSGPVAEYPIDHWGELITIPVVWAGKPACFVIDTGAVVSCVDTVSFPDLKPVGFAGGADTPGGKTSFGLCNPPDLSVGPFQLSRGGPVASLDLSALRGRCDRPVIGILGVSAMKAAVLQIDYDNRIARFIQPDQQPAADWGQAFPIVIDQTVGPVVNLRLNGTEHRLLIDSGNNGSINLMSPDFDRLAKSNASPVGKRPILTAVGTVDMKITRLVEADISGTQFHDLIIAETKGRAGILGLDFMERNLVTIDLARRKFYFKPGKEVAHRAEENMAGLRVVRAGTDLSVRAVDPASPAATAGLQAGDVLLELNQKPAETFKVPDAMELFSSGDGQPVKIKFRRGDQQPQSVEFKLRRAI